MQTSKVIWQKLYESTSPIGLIRPRLSATFPNSFWRLPLETDVWKATNMPMTRQLQLTTVLIPSERFTETKNGEEKFHEKITEKSKYNTTQAWYHFNY